MVHLQEDGSMYSYGTLRYGTVCFTCTSNWSMYNVPYRTITVRVYIVQPSSWRWTLRVETCRRHQKIKNYNVNLGNVHFVGLYCIIILQCAVQKQNTQNAIYVRQTAVLSVCLSVCHTVWHKCQSKDFQVNMTPCQLIQYCLLPV
jgi:hypothetical protein